jgi:hypothetical protein
MMTPRYVFKDGKFDKIVWEKEEQEAEILNFKEDKKTQDSNEDEKQAS